MAKINLSGDVAAAMRVAMRPMLLLLIAQEAIAEIASAHEKHGSNADLADGTGKYASILAEAGLFGEDGMCPDNDDVAFALKLQNDQACDAGRKHTRLGILLEEAFEAAETENPKDLRAELVQVAAMAIDWIADLDARA